MPFPSLEMLFKTPEYFHVQFHLIFIFHEDILFYLGSCPLTPTGPNYVHKRARILRDIIHAADVAVVLSVGAPSTNQAWTSRVRCFPSSGLASLQRAVLGLQEGGEGRCAEEPLHFFR